MILKMQKEFTENFYKVTLNGKIENGILNIKIEGSNNEDKLEYEYHLYRNSTLIEKIEYSSNNSADFILETFGRFRVKVFVKGSKGIYSFFTDFANYTETTALKYLNKDSDGFEYGIYLLIKVIEGKDKTTLSVENIIEKLQIIQTMDYNIVKYFKEQGIKEISVFGYQDEVILSKLLWINTRYSDDFKIKEFLSNTPFVHKMTVPRTIDLRFTVIDSNKIYNPDDIIVVCSAKKDAKEIDMIRRKTKANIVHISELVNKVIILQSIVNPLKKMKKANPYVKFIACTLPNINKITNRSNNENNIIKNNINLKTVRNNLSSNNPIIPMALKRFSSDVEYNKELMGINFANGLLSEHVNAVNNFRVTTDTPNNYTNTIYLFGNSITFGLGAKDEETIASYLQRMVNTTEKKYRVLNYANHASNDYDYQFKLMENVNFKPGDIVVSIVGVKVREDDSYVTDNTQTLFDRPHDYGEIFIDRAHINKIGNEIIAKSLFDTMKKNNFFENVIKNKVVPKKIAIEEDDDEIESLDVDYTTSKNIPKTTSTLQSKSIDNTSYKNTNNIVSNDMLPELNKYKQFILNYKVNANNIGAIVMNCNPFTYGHKYLIETAAKMVDYLYVFVVSENKSEFSFDDRFKLVIENTKDIPNITILASGKFIISQLTFSDYFSKDNVQDKVVDITDDAYIFATEIAPILNIKKRFVGEEPFCNVTRQYNEGMAKIFPKYGIDLVVIPRTSFNNTPISASEVRKLYKEGNFTKLEKLVPPATYNYLVNRYRNTKIKK